MLPPKPLEFADFSGGITENYLQSDPRRYERADNYLIQVDRSLEERPGLVPFTSNAYFLGNAPSGRVNSFFSFINGTQLIPNSGRSLFYYDKTNDRWPEIFGMNGNQALQGGDANSQVSFAEFQRQIYLTSDGDEDTQGVLPSKIYRDETNSWVARTVGLPRAFVPGTYTNETLLAACLVLANDIRASMIAHFNDALYPTFNYPGMNEVTNTNLHLNIDKYSLSYLVAQSFDPSIDPEVPDPIPTPAPNATDEATLFTLIEAMNLSYMHHMADSMLDSYGSGNSFPAPSYHQNPYTNPLDQLVIQTLKGPGATLANNAKPDSLVEAASMLDDLAQKWNWHRKAVNVHSPTNDPVQFDRYAVLASKIGTVTFGNQAPLITPDWGDLYAYINNLRYQFNYHAVMPEQYFGTHKQRDNYSFYFGLEVRLPECNNLDDMYLLIYWLRCMYYLHGQDARVSNFINVQFTATGGSTSLTSITRTDTGASYQIPSQSIIESIVGFQPRINQYNGDWQYNTAVVASSGVGTATLDRPASFGGVQTGQISIARYHTSRDAASGVTLQTRTTRPGTASELMANTPIALGTDIDSWMTLANEMFTCFEAHATNQAAHMNNVSNIWGDKLIGSVPYPNFLQPTTAFYSYAFFFTHEYTVEQNGIQYLVQGNPVLSSSQQAAISYPVDYIPPNQDVGYFENLPVLTQRGNLLSGLPVLANTGETNYDLDKIKLNIYRTTDGGNTYYLLAQVPNGTTSYLDVINDTVANPGDTALTPGRQTIYTSGGVQGWDQPPVCKFTHILNGVAYYGAITDAGQYFPQRIVQAIQNSPDGSPLGNYLDLDDELTGLSSTRSNLIALCKSSIFRVTGGFNTLGQGLMNGEKISDTLGCVNAKSIVRTEIGVFFAGTDGFYYTDGYQIIKVSIDLDETYAALTKSASQKRSIYGGYDQIGRRIYWAMKTTETDTDNGVLYVLHVDYGVKPSGAFTTASNGLNFRPSSLVFQDGKMYMGHEKGAILRSDEYIKYDAEVDFNYYAVDWLRLYIPYDFKSSAVDMGTTFQRKWLTKVHLVGKNHGDQAIQPWALRDLNQTQAGRKAMAPINYAVNPRWGTPNCIWGESTQKWEYDGKVDVWRRFPATVLRSDFMQVQFTPSYMPVYVSSIGFPFGANAVVDAVAKTATIQTPAGYTDIVWPDDIIGYEIGFAYDDYVNTFPIIRPYQSETVSFSVLPASGTWRLSYNGNVTGALAYNANAAAVQVALRLLPGLGAVVVTGDYSAGFQVLFNGVTGQPALLSVVQSTLLGTPTWQQYTVTFPQVPDGGNWAPSLNGLDNGLQDYDATANTFRSNLAGIPPFVYGATTVTGDATVGFLVTLVGFNGSATVGFTFNFLTYLGNPVVPVSIITVPYAPGSPSIGTVTRDPIVYDPQTLMFSDPDNLALSAPEGVEWQIMGYKKEQRVSMKSFVMHFAYLGNENESYPGRASNAGPGNGGYNP